MDIIKKNCRIMNNEYIIFAKNIENYTILFEKWLLFFETIKTILIICIIKIISIAKQWT